MSAKAGASQRREMNCPGWHNSQDKRRHFRDDRGSTLYKPTLCKNKDDCLDDDRCKMSHNYYESFYHPASYKKKRCANEDRCKNQNYCPYFHSQEEKGTWNQIFKNIFDLRESEVVIIDETNWQNAPAKRVRIFIGSSSHPTTYATQSGTCERICILIWFNIIFHHICCSIRHLFLEEWRNLLQKLFPLRKNH